MAHRTLAGCMFALGVLLAACGGASEPPAQPSTSVEETGSISEADALTAAEGFARDQGFSLEGLTAKPSNLFGEWQVSFEPTAGESLAGGFLVVLDDNTGELIDVIEYQ